MHSQAEKDIYIAYCEKDKSIPIYLRPAWLDIVCGKNKWDVIIIKESDHIEAVFPYFTKTKYGLKIIALPPLTQYLGAHFIYPQQGLKQERKIAFENRVGEKIISRLPKHHLFNVNFSPNYQNWLAFMWEGFKQSVRYSYVIDTKAGEDQLWSDVKSKTRNVIRKAENNFTVTLSKDVNEMIKLNTETFSRQQSSTPYDTDLIRQIYETFSRDKRANIFTAKNESGTCVAAIMTIEDWTASYCLFIGSNDQGRRNGAVSLLLWNAIKMAKTKKLKFDFEGSIMKNIEPFFRSFGGRQVPYFNIKRTSNKFLETILMLTNKI